MTQAGIDPYKIPAATTETRPWEHPDRLFSARLPVDWLATTGKNDDGTIYALFEFPRLGSGIRFSLAEYPLPKKDAALGAEALLAVWMRNQNLSGAPIHSFEDGTQKRAAAIYDTPVTGDPRRTVFEIIKAGSRAWLVRWEGWIPNWDDHAPLLSQVSRNLRFPSALTDADRSQMTSREVLTPENSGEVKGMVWWILEPAKGVEKPDNRQPARGVVLDVWTAKQTGFASQAGEPPRPTYAAGRFYKSFRPDEKGEFRFRLPPGVFEIRAAGNMVVQIGGGRIVSIAAGSSVKLEILVTGGV